MSYWKSAVVSLLTGVMIASSAIQPVAIYAETVLDEGGQADSAQDGSVQADGSESDRSTSDEPVDSEAEVSQDADEAPGSASTDMGEGAASTDGLAVAQDDVSEAEESVAAEDASEANTMASRTLVENSWRYQNGQRIESLDDESAPSGDFLSRAMDPLPDGATAQGIDVSEFQGKIDWDAVKAAGVDFAILRIGYGDQNAGDTDKYFKRNVEECERLGIKWGAYLYSYSVNTKEAADEAAHVLSAMKGLTPDLPIYYDMEDDSTLGAKDRFADIAQTFCSKIEAAGYDAGVYASARWWKYYLTSPVFDSWSKWSAQYYKICEYPSDPDAWQYTSQGKVPGISGNVDVNYAYEGLVPSNYAAIVEAVSNCAERYAKNLGAEKSHLIQSSDFYFQQFDNGIVVWTPRFGANPVYGDVYQYWLNSGGIDSDLGLPVAPQADYSCNGGGIAQDFENGSIHITSKNIVASVMSGPIRTEYVRRGYQAGPLGWPVAEAESLPGGGSRQRFQNGSIVSSPKGTFEMDGEIEALWLKKGGASGALGYPVTNALHFSQNGSGYAQDFEGGSIHWHWSSSASERTASVMSGPIRTEYVRRGYQAGPLGWPVAEAESLPGGGSRQRFQNAWIHVDSKGAVSVEWIGYHGFQNPPQYYQVSSNSVVIPHLGEGIFGYRTESRISKTASKLECINTMIGRAYEYLGTPYKWDYSCAPGVGVDCSGLVMQCLYAVGMDLSPFNPWDHFYTPGHDQYANGMWDSPRFKHLSFSERQRGDLVCYPRHIAIYLGNDKIIEAYSPAVGVRIASVYSSSHIRGVLRPFV